MSEDTIRCLVYRYKRTTKERLCAVVIKESQFKPLNEIEYKANDNFFLNSEFADFIGYTSGCSIDFCIINQNEYQGEEFSELCKKYYNYTGVKNTVWNNEFIHEALSLLELKRTLVLGDISIKGRDESRPDIVSIYADNEVKPIAAEDSEESIQELLEEQSISDDFSLDKDINGEFVQSDTEKNTAKSKLSLAMDKIIHETYNK